MCEQDENLLQMPPQDIGDDNPAGEEEENAQEQAAETADTAMENGNK